MTNQSQDALPSEAIVTDQAVINIILAEYNNLRAEMGNRIGLEYQIISLTLVALGVVIALGVKPENIVFILLYPVLILFLSAIWQDNQLRIEDISTHIKTKIAPRVGKENLSWEHSQMTEYYKGKRGILHGLLSLFGKRGAFISNEIVVILIGLSLVKFDITQFDLVRKISLVIGIISIIMTILILIFPSLPLFFNSTWHRIHPYNTQVNEAHQKQENQPTIIEH